MSLIEHIDEFRSREIQAIKDHKAAGRKVAGMLCKHFPASILWGLGAWPVRLVSGASGYAESSGEKLVRPDTCPFCKSTLGNFLNKDGLHAYVDCIIGLITCDQVRRTLERLAADLQIPVFPLQVPATDTPASRRYFVKAMQSTVDNIRDYLGASIDYDAVRRYEGCRAGAAEYLKKLLFENMGSPLLVHRLMHLFAWTRPESFLSFIEGLYPRLQPFASHSTVLLIGSTVCDEDDAVLSILEAHRIRVVPVNCTGLSMVDGLTPVADIPDAGLIAGLSERSLSAPACIRRRPNGPVYEYIKQSAARAGAKGVILKTLSFCDLWYTEKERLKRSLDVPLLVLDTGYGEGSRAQLQTRLETFLETI